MARFLCRSRSRTRNAFAPDLLPSSLERILAIGPLRIANHRQHPRRAINRLEAFEHLAGWCVHDDDLPSAGRFRIAERNGPSLEIDLSPAQIEDLRKPAAGIEQELDGRSRHALVERTPT